MPSVKITDLAKGMLEVYAARYKSEKKKLPPVKIRTARERERFHEFLISPAEIPFCHDLGNLYKISREINNTRILTEQFSSETAPRISQEKLYRIIDELFEEFSY